MNVKRPKAKLAKDVDLGTLRLLLAVEPGPIVMNATDKRIVDALLDVLVCINEPAPSQYIEGAANSIIAYWLEHKGSNRP